MKQKLTHIALIAGLTISLSACNLEDWLKEQVDDDKLKQITSGIITKLDNELEVNGISFDTSGATISIDDSTGSSGDLSVGMYVTVQGSVNSDGTSGSATSIYFENELEGPLSLNNIATDGTLSIMGQTVLVDVNTRFESEIPGIAAIADIGVDSYIEVSGYASGNGQITATHIELKAADSDDAGELEIKGQVTELTTTTFRIGGLTIDYSQARFDDFGSRALENGLYVEVKSYQAPLNNTLIASKIELEDKHHREGYHHEVEGLVSNIGTNAFQVNNITVIYDGNTRFDDGSIANLRNGVRVEVEGNFDEQGRLYANEIEFEDGDDDDRDSSDD